jgi:methylated-DNA-[protein]-cysteine S-methyltransferase
MREGSPQAPWRWERIVHPSLPLLLATDGDDRLVYVGLGSGLDGLRGHAARHGAAIGCERRGRSAAGRQLADYLAGHRRDFDLALRPLGTAFQRAAWQALQAIPYGHTSTYGEQARRLGRPGASRAVGRANAKNPLPIVIPCHRVIGRDGNLVGFGGGVRVKRWLLEHEAAQLPLDLARA